MGFVNPYNFAPFPAEVRRNRAWGHVGPATTREGDWFHEEGRALYSGRIEVQWELKTPLQLPPGDALHEWWDPGTSTVRIPGSSIKGAVRSLHEAMFNGCLRIFDEKYIPVHRMPAVSAQLDEDEEWRLALVTRAADGLPTALRLTDKLTFVSAPALAQVMSSVPTTGDVVELNIDDRFERPLPNGNRRYELPEPTVERVTQRGEVQKILARDRALEGCVFIVTSISARGKHPISWAAAELTDEVHVVGPRDAPALRLFVECAEGTDDRRRAIGGEIPGWQQRATFAEVRKGPLLGRRIRQTGLLFAGDVVWVRLRHNDDGPQLKEMLLSQLWRHKGEHEAGSAWRVGGTHLACKPGEEGEGLCLSCATFGSIDATKKDESDGESVGYGGHVRFSSATANGVSSQVVTRAPLSAPKPSAGPFYLRGLNGATGRTEGDVASHWGSEADTGAKLRGRKFYWHSDPDQQSKHWHESGATSARPRYKAAPGQPLAVDGVRVVDPKLGNGRPTVLTGSVSFDRLPMPAVQALLAAIVPQRVADCLETHRHRSPAVRLGGGKPLGLGSAVPTVAAASLWTVAERYGSGPRRIPPLLDVEKLRAIVGQVGTPPLGQLLRLLDLDGLSRDEQNHVSYPPALSWSAFGTKDFAESYQFFSDNNGLQKAKGKVKPFTTLPLAGDPQIIRWEP
ncbi:hypothetical protein [Tessaracoccus defluvii]|uniref:hypothetical protein n=1 Tax=Tessaracoccus defluvii TaxID=1285901 RepID=UPI0031D3FF42